MSSALRSVLVIKLEDNVRGTPIKLNESGYNRHAENAFLVRRANLHSFFRRDIPFVLSTPKPTLQIRIQSRQKRCTSSSCKLRCQMTTFYHPSFLCDASSESSCSDDDLSIFAPFTSVAYWGMFLTIKLVTCRLSESLAL